MDAARLTLDASLQPSLQSISALQPSLRHISTGRKDLRMTSLVRRSKQSLELDDRTGSQHFVQTILNPLAQQHTVESMHTRVSSMPSRILCRLQHTQNIIIASCEHLQQSVRHRSKRFTSIDTLLCEPLIVTLS